MIYSFFFFFNDTATTEIYTLSLHDALPIWQFPQARVALGGREAPMVRPPGQGGQLPGRRVYGLCLSPRPCFARLPVVPASGVGTGRATTPGMPCTACGALSNAPSAVLGDARRVEGAGAARLGHRR